MVGNVREVDAKSSAVTIGFALWVEGTLIDFETTGIPGKSPSHEVVTLSYLTGDELTVIQRETKEREPFYDMLRDVICQLPRPFYSYNSRFEFNVMRLELGIEVDESQFVDLMLPWRQTAEEHGKKWPRLGELISEPQEYFGNRNVSGGDVPELWHQFTNGGGDGILATIAEHCVSDVIREATLLFHYNNYLPPFRALSPGV